MGKTLIETLADLKTQRQAVADAITAKGGTVASGAKLADLASAVGTITGGGGGGVSVPAWVGTAAYFTISYLALSPSDFALDIVLLDGYPQRCTEIEQLGVSGQAKSFKLTVELGIMQNTFMDLTADTVDLNGYGGNASIQEMVFFASNIKHIKNVKLNPSSFQTSNPSEFQTSEPYCTKMFAGSNLWTETITFCEGNGGIGNTLTDTDVLMDLSYYTHLTADGVVGMFQSLDANTSGKVRTVKIPSAVLSAMTADQIAVATGKGYTLTA